VRWALIPNRWSGESWGFWILFAGGSRRRKRLLGGLGEGRPYETQIASPTAALDDRALLGAIVGLLCIVALSCL
jgi:hypothetical protein